MTIAILCQVLMLDKRDEPTYNAAPLSRVLVHQLKRHSGEKVLQPVKEHSNALSFFVSRSTTTRRCQRLI
jgi:hypothetical protein